MQVNVKELTGALHLNLVFMIVLVLQSFLAVFPKVSLVYSSVLCQLFQAPSIFKFPKCCRYSMIGALSP